MPVMIRFRTETGSYAIPVEQTVGVRLAGAVVALPAPAAGVAGVLDVDGESVPVVRALGDGTRHVVLVRGAGQPIGLLADEVMGIVDVPAGAVAPPPPGQATPLVGGVVRWDDDAAFVVDVDAVCRTVSPLSPTPAQPRCHEVP